jgi:RHS repeat-associated protein
MLLTGKDTYYDGSGTLGAPIGKGDPTRMVDAVAASTVDTATETVTTSATFDDYGRTLTETDGNGNITRTGYDPSTGPATTVTETNALGQAEVTTFEPDRLQPAAVRDANGRVTTNTYDPLGRLASVRTPEQAANDPAAKVFEYFLDPGHTKPPLVTTKELQSGSTYQVTWSFLDSFGRDRQTQETSPAATSGAPKTIVTDTRYDEAGHVQATSLPVVVAGPAGTDLIAVPGDAVDETRHTYDAIGREVRSAQFAGARELWATTTAFFGDHVRTTPPAGGAVSTTWSDVRDRPVRKEDGTGSSLVATTFSYTPSGQVESVTDPASHRATYSYDLLQRLVEGNDPDSGRYRTRYDANSNVVARFDARTLAAGGSAPTQATEYDRLNRPTAQWSGASGTGTKIAAWTYDSTTISNGIGRIAAQTTIDAGRSYTQANLGFDPRGRVTAKSWTFPPGTGGSLGSLNFKVNYAYDAADHQVSISYVDGLVGAPAETITTGYNALGDPTTLTGSVTDPLTGRQVTVPYISDTGYAADSKLASRDYANPLFPLRRAYAYEADTQRLSRMQTLVHNPVTGGTEAKQDDTYRWDQAGNTTAITDGTLPEPVSTCFTYDPLRRLTHGWTTKQTDCSDASSTLTHDGPAGFNQSYAYSPDGNLTSVRSLGSTSRRSYSDPAHPHAVSQVDSQTYRYDANGALTDKPALLGLGARFGWNSQHQLVSATKDLVSTTSFVYLPDGTRMARVDPLGSATLYIDGQEISVILGVAAGTRYYRQAGTLVAERLGTGLGLLTWQFNDMQGSAQIAVAQGTPLPLRTYYGPYGDIRLLSAPPLTDHGWLGKTKDLTTGLHALGNRYYDDDLGRFISTDPANDLSSAQTANPYSYGANNPITYTDPTGLWSLSGAWNGVKNAASSAVNWVDEHKGLIADVAVGIGVGIAIGAVCATGVGCVILAGAVAGAAGAAAGYGVDVAEGKQDFSLAGLATNVGIGAAAGALGAGVGKLAAPLLGKAAGAVGNALSKTGAGRAVVGAASKAGVAFSNGVRSAENGIAKGVAKVASKARQVDQLAKPGALRSAAVAVHDLATPAVRHRMSTVAIAEVRQAGQKAPSYFASGSSGRLSEAQKALLKQFGIPEENIVRGSAHAEINILNALPEGAKAVRWGIAWAGGNKPIPCDACAPMVKGIIEGAS